MENKPLNSKKKGDCEDILKRTVLRVEKANASILPILVYVGSIPTMGFAQNLCKPKEIIKMKVYKILINSTFTFQMVDSEYNNIAKQVPSNWNQIQQIANIIEMSAKFNYIPYLNIAIELDNGFGHPSTAKVLETKKGVYIQVDRKTLAMQGGFVFVAQYKGKRLEEGATELPPKSKLIPVLYIINKGLTGVFKPEEYTIQAKDWEIIPINRFGIEIKEIPSNCWEDGTCIFNGWENCNNCCKCDTTIAEYQIRRIK